MTERGEFAVPLTAILAWVCLAIAAYAIASLLEWAFNFLAPRSTAPCEGCALGRVRIIGPWYARRRECIYCRFCMPELPEYRNDDHA